MKAQWPLSRTQAEAQGFNVDSHCYPWIAYKGPRFKPTEWVTIPTDVESDLRRQLDAHCGAVDRPRNRRNEEHVEWVRSIRKAAQ